MVEKSKLISPRSAGAIVVCIVAGLAFALLGLAYTALVGGDKTFGTVAGAVIGVSVAAFEVFVVQGSVGEPLRRLPLWGLILVSTGVWILSIVVGILIIAPLIISLDVFPDWYREWYLEGAFLQDLIFCLLVAVLINVSIRIHSLVGARVLLNFLLGRYHRPLREQQVFMFVDILDARGLSSRLGDVHAQSLIAEVFFDIDGAITEFAGEVHRYIGDELVVTWPFRRGTKDASCVKCALKIVAVVQSRAEHYRDVYGEAPRLRVALHGGPIVVSEIGDDRREIVYFGDTINTTARLRGLAKKIQRRLVVSAELLEHMPLPEGVSAEDMGSFELSGKAEATRVCALHDAHEGPVQAST